MALQMHTAAKKADWQMVSSKKWNIWQKMAAQSRGLMTPANVVSLAGGVLTIAGFLQFQNGITLLGIALIVIGRLADIADGYIAHITGTKSPLGEFVDTSIDKLTILFGLIIITIFGLMPAIFTAAILIQSLLNAGASLLGRSRGTIIHPSQHGKLATFLAWITIISYLTHGYLEDAHGLSAVSVLFSVIAYAAFIVFTLLAVTSTASYLSQLRK